MSIVNRPSSNSTSVTVTAPGTHAKEKTRAAVRDPTRGKIAASGNHSKKAEIVHHRGADRNHQQDERCAARGAKLTQRHPAPSRPQIRVGSEQDCNDPVRISRKLIVV